MVRKRKESRVCWSSRRLPFKPSRAFLFPPDHNPDSSPGSGGPPSFGPAYVISGSTSCRAPWPSPQPPTCPARIAAPLAAALHDISSLWEAVIQTSAGLPASPCLALQRSLVWATGAREGSIPTLLLTGQEFNNHWLTGGHAFKSVTNCGQGQKDCNYFWSEIPFITLCLLSSSALNSSPGLVLYLQNENNGERESWGDLPTEDSTCVSN